jgi:hypothetical protein
MTSSSLNDGTGKIANLFGEKGKEKAGKGQREILIRGGLVSPWLTAA